jgi:hypothetical protein
MGILNYLNYQLTGANATGADQDHTGTFSGSAAATIDVYLHYDMKLIIRDGMLTVHV